MGKYRVKQRTTQIKRKRSALYGNQHSTPRHLASPPPQNLAGPPPQQESRQEIQIDEEQNQQQVANPTLLSPSNSSQTNTPTAFFIKIYTDTPKQSYPRITVYRITDDEILSNIIELL